MSRLQEELDELVYEQRSLGTWEMRINPHGTGALTVEKRHEERLKELNPHVMLYKGFLFSDKGAANLFMSRIYNPNYACYVFYPYLCNMDGCSKPVCLDSRQVKTVEGRKPHLCQTHFDMAFGGKKKR